MKLPQEKFKTMRKFGTFRVSEMIRTEEVVVGIGGFQLFLRVAFCRCFSLLNNVTASTREDFSSTFLLVWAKNGGCRSI